MAKTPEPNPLLAWAQTQVDRHYKGRWVRLTRDLGVSTALKRTLEAGHISEMLVLHLAVLRGESPAKLLRLAGKTEFADLLERLYREPVMLPSSVQAVVDAMMLHDPEDTALTEWQTATAAAARLVLRGRKGTTPTGTPQPARGPGDDGKRPTRGTRRK